MPNVSLKYGGRNDQNSIFASGQSGLEYKPKYKLIFPKDDLMIPNFEKTVPRKPNIHACYTLNESSVVYDDYNREDFSPIGKKSGLFFNNLIFLIIIFCKKRIYTPLFEKMLSREMSLNDSKISLKQTSSVDKPSKSERNLLGNKSFKP